MKRRAVGSEILVLFTPRGTRLTKEAVNQLNDAGFNVDPNFLHQVDEDSGDGEEDGGDESVQFAAVNLKM